MDLNDLKQLPFDEVRRLYKPFLKSQGISPNTIRTAYGDSFYLWRYGNHDLFWNAVEGNDTNARAMLLDVLQKNTTGNPDKLVNGYLSHLRRFRLFLASEGISAIKKEQVIDSAQFSTPGKHHQKLIVDIPTPSREQVEKYITRWNE